MSSPESATMEAEVHFVRSSKDEKWAMYHGYLCDEDSWEQPPSDFDAPVEPETRWTKVKTRTKEFLETVTLDGIAQTCGARHWLRRLVWLAFFTLCTVYGLMQCYEVYNEYIGYPKAVSVQLQTERPAQFPAVTLCNLNPINNEEKLRNDSVYGAFIDVQENNTVTECEDLKSVSNDPLDKYLYDDDCELDPLSGLDEFLEYFDDPLEDLTNYVNETITGAIEDVKEALNAALNLTNGTIIPTIPPIFPVNASIVSVNPTLIPVNVSTIPGIASVLLANSPTIGGFPVPGRRKKRAFSPTLIPLPFNSTILPKLPTLGAQNTRVNKTDPSPYMEKDKAFQRLQCSFIYQYQTKLEEQTKKNFTFATDVGTVDYAISELVKSVGNMQFCANVEAWINKSVTIRYNQVCRKEVYEDLLGNYTDINRAYNETYINATHVSVSCSSGVHDLRNLWQPAKEINMTDKRVKALVSRSRTNDLSDLRGRFAPDRDVVEKTARKREDFVQVCSIDNVHCNYKLFHPYTTKDMGVCYTFNSPHLVRESSPNVSIEDRRKNFKPRASYKTGPQSGLSLTLNLHAASYLSLLSPWSGLRVVLHEPWQAPFPADEGFNLAAGLSHSIAVTKTVMNRVGPPHGQCADTSSKMFDYSEALCNKLCIEREFRRRCNCTVNEGPAFDSLGEEDEFKAKKFVNCDAFDRFQGLCMQAVNYMSTTEELKCNCDPACKEVRYSALISSTDVNREFLKIVQNIKQVPMGGDLCGEWNSTVRLQIYIDSFSFEQIEESPAYTWATLIANLGGNLGFVGVSLITVFDVVYYIFDVFLILVWPRCYDVSEGVTKSVAPVKKIPKKIIILAGPPEQLPHGQPSKKRPLRSKDRWTDRFNQVFMSE